MKRTAIFSLLLSGSIFSAAQSDTLDLLPVEVRAVSATEKAPFAKTNISKKEIEKANLGQDLPFVLRHTPSVVVNSDAGNGFGYTGLRIRGSDATRINVTLNGIPFNDAESGGTFFVDLPDFISSANSIQVQRGVGTSSNGAGAFGASIHISTNELLTKPYLELNNSFGSFNSWKNTLKVGTGLLGKHFTIDGRLSRLSSDGYIDRASSDLKSYYFSTAYHSEKNSLRFTTFSGDEKTYQAWYGVSESDLKKNRRVNYAGTEKPGSPYENETDNYKQQHYQLFYNQKINGSILLNGGLFLVRGKGFYEQYKADKDYSDYGLQPVTVGNTVYTSSDLIRQLWLDNYFYGTVFSLLYQKPATTITLGGALTNYDGKHYGEVVWAEKGLNGNTRWYNNKADKNDANVYVKWQQNLNNQLQLFSDLQWRYVAHQINGFRYNPGLFLDKSYHFINPKLGLTYSSNDWKAFTSVAFTQKEPNRDDFEAGAQELPKPEKLMDLETGLEKNKTNYSYGAHFFLMKYKDQLVLTGKINDVGAYTRTNIKESYRTGVELQGSYQPIHWLDFSANLTVSRNRVKNFQEFVDDYDNGGQKSMTYSETNLSFSPDATANSIITVRPFSKMEIALLNQYVGKQYLDNTSNEARKLNAYFLQDIRFNYNTKWKALKNISFLVQVNNVFDKKYEPNGYTFSYYYNQQLTTENYYFPMAGTNWMAGINIKL